MAAGPEQGPRPDGRALVLGGGGVTGIAWEIGMLLGLAEAGCDLRAADLVLGTSAGAAVAAQVTSGVALQELFEAQLQGRAREIPAQLGAAGMARLLLAMAWPGSAQRSRARLGRAARAARTPAAAARREVIERRLPVHSWPAQQLWVTAVDADTGAFCRFDRDSNVPLVDAVAASCAVPLVWPPVTIGSRTYVDGGVRSPANADLAAGFGTVVVIAPQAAALRRADRVEQQVRRLGPGVRSAVLTPDAGARAAMGRNALDPAAAAAAAHAGRAQGAQAVRLVRVVR